MRAESLRIGNWIKIRPKNSDKPWRYIQVDSSVLAVLEGKRGSHFEYAPIEIIEEILLKAGFSNIEKTDVFDCFNYPYWVKNGVILLYNSSPPENTYNIGYAEMRCGKYHAVLCRWISKLHELQNFYKEARGEELNIDLNTDKK